MSFRLLRPIWRVDDVTATQRLVLLALCSCADRSGANSYPSQATLARMCVCTTRTIRRTLADLIAKGLIEKTGKGRAGTIRYRVVANVLPNADAHVRQDRTPMSTNKSKEQSNRYQSETRDSYFDSGSRQQPSSFWTETVSEQAQRLNRERRQRK